MKENYFRYTEKGRWVGWSSKGENCTDPKKLYERVMNKPESFMHGARIYYFHGKNSTYKKISPKSNWFKKLYHHLDFGFEGGTQCYELKIPQYAQAYGIKRVKFYFKYETHRTGDIYVYFHYPGQLLTNLDIKSKAVNINEKFEFDIDHELHQVLELGGEYCNPDIDYNQDNCVLNNLFNVSTLHTCLHLSLLIT